MFKLQKHKSHLKSRGDNHNHNHNNNNNNNDNKLDFKFSDFHAIKVPKGWDKLFVYLVSVETGKTVVKSGKTSVRNGTCGWTETFCETLCFSEENQEANQLGGCLCKFVVAMGSSRSGILGEVTVDLVNYASSRTTTPLSLPLKKCQYGTSLQLKVQCLTPKLKYRDAQRKEANTDAECGSSDHDDTDSNEEF